MRRFFASFLLACAFARGQSGPDALRAALESLRPHAQEHRETRGATPALTPIKHQLRAWVEVRLQSFPRDGDEDALNRELQESMGRARLLCPDGCVFTSLGYVDPVRVRHLRLQDQGEFLIVQTSVGIACGYDDSAYAYEWSGAGWRRIFETEQTDYTEAGYLPQTIYAVQVSEPDSAGERLVLTLGSRPACSNAFLPVYYRLWRIGPNGGARKLLDASETAYIGAYPPLRASLSSTDLRIQFTAGGTGYGSGHEAERHFVITADGARQVEPIAPAPRDFVEEWLAAPWSQSARFSESAALEAWHKKLHRDDGMGDFPDPPLQCASDPNLWQIGIRLHGVDGETFYLVRWAQPDHFTMVEIAVHPRCGVR